MKVFNGLLENILDYFNLFYNVYEGVLRSIENIDLWFVVLIVFKNGVIYYWIEVKENVKVDFEVVVFVV